MGKYLDDDGRRLYELIWKRTVACQMVPATLNTVSVELAAGSEHGFRASGTTVIDPGFLAVYEEGKDQKAAEDDDEGRKLPLMKPGDKVPLDRIHADQHFTQPPPRFTEAALVKALEEYGIGRPSTYASIIQTLQFRKYVEMEGRAFKPSDVGRAVSKFLSGHFTRYVDYDFTAKLEDELDAVSRGEADFGLNFIGSQEPDIEFQPLAEAQSSPLSVRSGFRLGDAGVLCTAQAKPTDPRLRGMFDRGYLITCRDAAGAVACLFPQVEEIEGDEAGHHQDKAPDRPAQRSTFDQREDHRDDGEAEDGNADEIDGEARMRGNARHQAPGHRKGEDAERDLRGGELAADGLALLDRGFQRLRDVHRRLELRVLAARHRHQHRLGDAQVHIGLAEVDGHQLRVAVGEVQEADVAELRQVVQRLSRARLGGQHVLVVQGHAARTGDGQHLHEFTTAEAHKYSFSNGGHYFFVFLLRNVA